METCSAIWALTAFAIVTMVGLFVTKTKGFGKYTTSLLLLLVVLFLAAFFLVLDVISTEQFFYVLFAVTGFGGGLLNAKKSNDE